MPEKTQKQLAQETHQAVLGVEGTADKGLVGDVKDVVGILKTQNHRIRKLEIVVGSLIAALVSAGVLDAAIFNKVIGG